MRHLFQRLSIFEADNIFRYEDFITNPNCEIRRLVPQAAAMRRSLSAVDISLRYPNVDLPMLARALLPIVGSIMPFYPNIAEDLSRCINRSLLPDSVV